MEPWVSPLPLLASRVSAGFPSPADDHIETQLDLNRYLIKHPAATFFMRVAGDSMQGVGIHSGDLLVVDRSLDPCDGSVVVAVVNGDLTVKILRRSSQILALQAANRNYPTLVIQDHMDFQVWGVVTAAIHYV
ncbi:MAG: translesion error-prone DNA polymerase V autoproteolytic subunit [Synechococcaceae cyanobacterium SM2_3_1]|nr:translesion error-prone DNA polymerase V autoproteolytic subunit [Synechococcaceae cyanobacterium SM2_3_1]